MKNSERLTQEARQEDNDIKAHGIYTKALRETRLERFLDNDYYEQLIAKDCIITPFNGNKIVIDTQTEEFKILDYYPKANKILIRHKNQWKNMGLLWLKTNILK